MRLHAPGTKLTYTDLAWQYVLAYSSRIVFADALAVQDELVDFEWQVARDGYRVVAVAPGAVLHTDAEASGLPADQVMVTTAEPRYRYSVHTYAPLTAEPALFRAFGDLPATSEAIVAFADRYGLLGGSVEREVSVIGSDTAFVGTGEPVDAWLSAIEDMRRVVQEWDRARANAPFGPPRWQVPERVPPGRGLSLLQKSEAILGSQWRPDLLPNVQRTLNANLARETGARMLWSSEEGRLRLHLRPASLLGALWLQLAQAIDGDRHYRRCRVCASWFELRPDRARTNRAYCSDACRFKAYRGRQARARELHAEGQDMETIARELGSDVETIRKWTGGSDG